ncbi:MAG: hypothetical protein HOH43_04415 [Candidatus Latescibacteria bacterium]|jgi:hypothetical protein|nr:hypothetical protein [Candidatus Latescibacterota bacterium]
MKLTEQQKQSFHEDGYLRIPNAVPPGMITSARQAINHSLGHTGLHEADLAKYRAAAYCEELKTEPVLTDLFNRSSVRPAAEELIGPGNLQEVTNAQIALRFPSAPGVDRGEPHGHLDGLGSGTNGMEKGVYKRGFTVLAVLYLANVPKPYCGNFTVWPGSHRYFQDHFLENGHNVLSLGMPQVDLARDPVQVTGQAGDLVLAHYLLVHTAAPNMSADIRYATIARLRHCSIEKTTLDASYYDIWHEFPGLLSATSPLGPSSP